MLRIIPSTTFREGRWLNGMGVSWDIACDPPDAGMSEFGWRFAIARIDADVPFSDYKSVDRVFTLIEGNGLTLDMEGRPPLRVGAVHRPVSFPGDLPTTCRLHAGACRALNLFANRRIWSAEVIVGEGRRSISHGGPVLFFALNGTLRIDGEVLGTEDAALGDGNHQIDASEGTFYAACLTPVI